MEILVAAIVLILVIKFGLGLFLFCLDHWAIGILLLAAIIFFFA